MGRGDLLTRPLCAARHSALTIRVAGRLVPNFYPQRERQQDVGHGWGNHDPVEIPRGRSLALNAGTVERDG